MPLFDSNALIHRQARTRATFQNHAFLIDHVWHMLADRLMDIKQNFSDVRRLGTRSSPSALDGLVTRGKIAQTPDVMSFDPETGFLMADPESADCILSVFDLHTLNDLQGGLVQIRHALKQGGVFLAAFPGGESLHDLRTCLMQAEMELSGGAHPRVHPMIDLKNAAGLLQGAQFSLPVVDCEHITITYPNILVGCHDLRGMGETNILSARARTCPPRSLFARTEDLYRQCTANENAPLSARVDVIYMIGWK